MSYLPLNESDLTNRYPFNLTGFVEAAGLGAPRAGGWFDLRNGTTGSATTTTTTTGQGTSGGGGTATGKSVKASSEASLVRTGGGGDVWSVGGFARALVAVVGVAAWV